MADGTNVSHTLQYNRSNSDGRQDQVSFPAAENHTEISAPARAEQYAALVWDLPVYFRNVPRLVEFSTDAFSNKPSNTRDPNETSIKYQDAEFADPSMTNIKCNEGGNAGGAVSVGETPFSDMFSLSASKSRAYEATVRQRSLGLSWSALYQNTEYLCRFGFAEAFLESRTTSTLQVATFEHAVREALFPLARSRESAHVVRNHADNQISASHEKKSSDDREIRETANMVAFLSLSALQCKAITTSLANQGVRSGRGVMRSFAHAYLTVAYHTRTGLIQPLFGNEETSHNAVNNNNRRSRIRGFYLDLEGKPLTIHNRGSLPQSVEEARERYESASTRSRNRSKGQIQSSSQSQSTHKRCSGVISTDSISSEESPNKKQLFSADHRSLASTSNSNPSYDSQQASTSGSLTYTLAGAIDQVRPTAHLRSAEVPFPLHPMSNSSLVLQQQPYLTNPLQGHLGSYFIQPMPPCNQGYMNTTPLFPYTAHYQPFLHSTLNVNPSMMYNMEFCHYNSGPMPSIVPQPHQSSLAYPAMYNNAPTWYRTSETQQMKTSQFQHTQHSFNQPIPNTTSQTTTLSAAAMSHEAPRTTFNLQPTEPPRQRTFENRVILHTDTDTDPDPGPTTHSIEMSPQDNEIVEVTRTS